MEVLGIRLAKEVGILLADAGFKYVAKRQIFSRKSASGFDELLWHSHPTTDANGDSGQRYSLIVGVRHDFVEQAVNDLGLIHGDDNKRWTTTVDSPLAVFPPTQERKYSYVVSDRGGDDDVARAANEIASVFTYDAEPFYRRFASLNQCAEDLNAGMGSRSYWLVNNYENRMFRGIASSALSGGQAESVASQWLREGASILTERALKVAEERVGQLLKVLGGAV